MNDSVDSQWYNTCKLETKSFIFDQLYQVDGEAVSVW